MKGEFCPVCRSPEERSFIEGVPKLVIVSRVSDEIVKMIDVRVCACCGNIYKAEDAICIDNPTKRVEEVLV